MNRFEMTVFTVWVVFIIAGVFIGPGGAVSGIIGALVGAAIAVGLILFRRSQPRA